MNDTIRVAEACRQSADEARQIADGAHPATEREAFQRLAEGYDALARQLADIRPGYRREEFSGLPNDARFSHPRRAEH